MANMHVRCLMITCQMHDHGKPSFHLCEGIRQMTLSCLDLCLVWNCSMERKDWANSILQCWMRSHWKTNHFCSDLHPSIIDCQKSSTEGPLTWTWPKPDFGTPQSSYHISLRALKKFWHGESIKSGVLLSIFSWITKTKTLPPDIIHLTLEQWTENIDHTETILTNNEKRGVHAGFIAEGSPRPSRDRFRWDESPIDEWLNPKCWLDDDELEGSNDDEGGSVYWKQRIDWTKLLWYNRNTISRVTSNLIMLVNRCLLAYYTRNIAIVKQEAMLSSSPPEGIPPFEFENALCGQPVNLNNVFSTLHYVRPPKENVDRIGDTEICFEATKPAWTVKTATDWTAA